MFCGGRYGQKKGQLSISATSGLRRLTFPLRARGSTVEDTSRRQTNTVAATAWPEDWSLRDERRVSWRPPLASSAAPHAFRTTPCTRSGYGVSSARIFGTLPHANPGELGDA